MDRGAWRATVHVVAKSWMLNYSSVEARLFRRMLIALRSPRHILAFICCVPLGAEDQRFVKTATKSKIEKEKKGEGGRKKTKRALVLVLKGGLPGAGLWACTEAPPRADAVWSPLYRQGGQGPEG